MNRDELLDLIPAYALGALDRDEQAAFEGWITTDSEAQALLDEYRAVTNHLVMLAPARLAPAHLQMDLQRRLAAERPGTKRRWYWLVAAAAVIVLVIGVLIIYSRNRDEKHISGAEKLYASLIEQDDSVQFELEPGEGQDDTWGNLVASSEGDKAVICAWEMPDIAPDQTFQLWLIEPDGGIHSGGIFRADPDIAYIPVPLDKPLNTYQAVGVSIEPAGGSADGPTGPRVFRVYINS